MKNTKPNSTNNRHIYRLFIPFSLKCFSTMSECLMFAELSNISACYPLPLPSSDVWCLHLRRRRHHIRHRVSRHCYCCDSREQSPHPMNVSPTWVTEERMIRPFTGPRGSEVCHVSALSLVSDPRPDTI